MQMKFSEFLNESYYELDDIDEVMWRYESQIDKAFTYIRNNVSADDAIEKVKEILSNGELEIIATAINSHKDIMELLNYVDVKNTIGKLVTQLHTKQRDKISQSIIEYVFSISSAD